MKGKKISFLIILFSILMIIFSIVSKFYNGKAKHLDLRDIHNGKLNQPIEYLDVNFFGLNVLYIYILLFFMITLGIGIYLFVYNKNVLFKIMNNRKLSFSIILSSIILLIYGVLTKNNNSNYVEKTVFLKDFKVNVFGINIEYVNFLLFIIIILGIGIYLFIYEKDVSIKKRVKKSMFLNIIKKKYLKWEKNSLGNIEPLSTSELSENKVPTFVGLTTFFALCFTFFMGLDIGFSLWFFIILPYYHLISLTPKSKNEILIKSIGYPLIFLIIFSLIEKGSGETIMGMAFQRPLTYYISKHFLFFLVSVLIMYFTQKKRFDNPPKFSIKSPLFWISLISLLISILRFGVDKYYSI